MILSKRIPKLAVIALVLGSFIGVNTVEAQSTGALLNNPNSVFVSGNYAYVTSSLSQALEIIDISNPSSPVHKGAITNGTDGAALHSPTSVAVSGNYAYVTSRLNNALEIIDISDPTNPLHVSTLRHGDGGAQLRCPTQVVVSGNYAYISVSSCGNANPTFVEIVDISNPASPLHVSSYYAGALTAIMYISVSGDYLYFTYRCFCNGPGGFIVLDISNPASPVQVGGLSDGMGGAALFAPTSIYVSGNHAYLTVAGVSYSGALEIVDVSDPINVFHKGVIYNGDGGANFLNPITVAVSGNYAYVTSYGSLSGDALEIINISNPTLPTHAGTILNGEGDASLLYPASVFVSGNYAYIASLNSNTLEIVDISNPANPVHKGKLLDGELVGTPPVALCCSNVLFLPGIKGSVLVKQSLLNDVPDDQLWPSASSWNDDMEQLDLGEDGEGDAKIFVSGIVESYLGVDIYSSFADFMDGLVSDGLINEWLPRSYDWRFSPEKILEDGVKTDDETINIIEEIEELASRSQTGQVTIVAHSMGGLMGKAIIKELEEEGKGNLIDSFVMVGTPQLGTPEAVGVLLHGHEDFTGRLLFDQNATRKTGRNMPSAHNLLPSPEYFNVILDPAITFDPEAFFTDEWRDLWGNEISNYASSSSFLTGGQGVRERPEEDDLLKPEILRSDLVESAENFHNEFDTYQLPEHIRVVQVAGWGIPTIKAVNYRNRHFRQSYEPKFTTEGDGTVVYKSAFSQTSDETYYLDLYVFNALENEPNSRHRNLTSATPIQNLITNLVGEITISTDEFIRTTKPDPSNLEDKLIVSAHSPVVLGVYDESGNFTGIDPNQDLSGDTAEITENIPGSTYLYFGENQYIFLPKEGQYNFVYRGIGNGSTTIEIKDFVADTVTPITVYSDIPTTESTTATFAVNSEDPETTIIKLDTNSDGQTDEIIVSDDADIFDLLNLLRDKIRSSNIKEKLKANLLKKIDNLEKKIEKKIKKGKSLENIKKRIESIIKKILKKDEKGVINETDANEIVKLLEQIENGL